MNKAGSLVILLFFLQNYSFSQNRQRIDSLETQLKNHNARKIELRIKSPSRYDTIAANILGDLSKAYWYIDPDTAKVYAEQCMALSEQLGYKKGMGNAYNSMGVIHGMKGDYMPSLEFIKKALKIWEDMGDKKRIGNSYAHMGGIYYQQDNYPEALKYQLKSLKILEEVGEKKGLAATYANIGSVYNLVGNYSEALKNYLISLKIAKEIGDKHGIALLYTNIAIIYTTQGNYSAALKNDFAAIKIQKEIGDRRGLTGAYENIARIYNKQSNYPEALKYHLASLKIFKEIGDKDGIAITCVDIGEIFIQQKKYKEASEYLNNALALSLEIGSLFDIKISYNALATLDSAQGHFKQAFEHYKLYIAYRDSISNTENTEKIVALQMNYDFSKKQDSLNVVQAKKDIAAQRELDIQKLVRNKIIGGTVIFILLAGTAIVLFIDRMKRNRKKQMEEVRARISRDLHDDMGSTLQSISVMSEIARMKSTSNTSESIPILEKIGSASREMIDKMSDIVWAVSPQNDHFENILLHMRAFGGELLAGKDIVLHFKADSDLNNLLLSMEKRKSFFLVYKEALNNAYKYSGAKNVNVEISKTNQTLKLVVEDDGVGFNINEDRLKTGGNGLKNMNTRAAELNGNILITSEPGQGTKITLTVNLK
jgi:signal transduction histidine kinase